MLLEAKEAEEADDVEEKAKSEVTEKMGEEEHQLDLVDRGETAGDEYLPVETRLDPQMQPELESKPGSGVAPEAETHIDAEAEANNAELDLSERLQGGDIDKGFKRGKELFIIRL